jgi:hypothetical protein
MRGRIRSRGIWTGTAFLPVALAVAVAAGAEPPAGYLFAHMTKGDYGSLHYAVSTNGLHWMPLNGGRRVLEAYRGHPDITRMPDGRWVLLGNHPERGDARLWVSSNLVDWVHLRDFVADMSAHPGFEPPGKWHGAPKMVYDDEARRYVMTFHFSSRPGRRDEPEYYWSGMRTFVVTSPDLVSFTPARRLFDWDFATIDVILRRDGGRWFAIVKDERHPDSGAATGKTIRIAESSGGSTGPWSAPGVPLTPNFREAPMLIPRPDGGGWYLYFEQYPGISYGLLTAPRLGGPWAEVPAVGYRTPPGARHGCMIVVPREAWEGLSNRNAQRTP